MRVAPPPDRHALANAKNSSIAFLDHRYEHALERVGAASHDSGQRDPGRNVAAIMARLTCVQASPASTRRGSQ